MTTQIAKTEEPKPGVFRRMGSYFYHTLADTPTEDNDNRDLFQVMADTVMGPTPGRKAARSASAIGGATAVAGFASGSITLLTIGGITFIVGGTAEAVQYIRGRKSDVVDAPEVTASDEQAVEGVGMAEAAKNEDNLHGILKSVATGDIFQLNDRAWNQVWSQAKDKQLSKKNSRLYNSIVRLAARDGLVTLKDDSVPAAATA
jgi:hypothetical protein